MGVLDSLRTGKGRVSDIVSSDAGKVAQGRRSEVKSVDQALRSMNRKRGDAKHKGTMGEEACFPIVLDHIMKKGNHGYMYHSYKYLYAKGKNGQNLPGNIKLLPTGKFYSEDGNNSTHDEIDILYIGDFNIIAIEVKARGGKWVLNNEWGKQNSSSVDKYPIAQAEKHCRHLYHILWDVLPGGDPNRIIPLTVFVDKAQVTDKRSKEWKSYVPVAILNTLAVKLDELDVIRDTRIDIPLVMKTLKSKGSGTLYKGGNF